MKKLFVLCLIAAACALGVRGSRIISLNSLDGSAQWQLMRQADASGKTGADLSKAGCGMDGAVEAIVPGTTFASFVAAGREENPEWGDNIYRVDETWYNCPMWYRTEFPTPAVSAKERVWLHFDNTHRYASVYVNGVRVSGTDSSDRDVKGHMLRSRFDVTSLLVKDGDNAVAVLITDPDPKKRRTDMAYVNWCSPSYSSAAGWDWMPYVPGRLAGITGNVYLRVTGDVLIEHPWVRSALPSDNTAELTVKTGLYNTGKQSVLVTLRGKITPGDISFEKTYTVTAGVNREIIWDKSVFKSLVMDNPQLWWPNGYGEQNLYSCHLECLVNGKVSDSRDVTFGIRKYEYEKVNNSSNQPVWRFKVNGKPVYLKGGNWGISEYLLRCHGEEYEEKILLHKDMNFNMIRLWSGCVTDDEFYDYCDRHGIMVWDDFWIVFSYFGVSEKDVFKENALDKVRRLRNHPSIALWCGANECHPEDELDQYLANLIATEDGNDRMYKPCSNDDGLSGSGWWMNRTPDDYFGSAANAMAFATPPYPFTDTSGYGLRSELGMGTFPQYESVELFMPEDKHWPLPDDETLKNVDDNTWNHHFFGKEGAQANPADYKKSVNEQYGASYGLQEFCEKAQLLNIECMKGMFEAWNDKMWNDASGLLIWMSNPAYPSFLWQTYDYYHDATGAYWGAKHACEHHHIQWNSRTGSVKVINTSGSDMAGFTASAQVYDLSGRELAECARSASVSVPLASKSEAFVLSPKGNATAGIRFVRLTLADGSGNVVSENFYWHNCASTYDYRALASMPAATVECSVSANNDEADSYTVTLHNNSDAVAFATRIRLVNPVTGERILPVFMSDNFVTLMPRETRRIKVSAPVEQLGQGADVLVKQFRHPEFAGASFSGAGLEDVKADGIGNYFSARAMGNRQLLLDWGGGDARHVRVYTPQGALAANCHMRAGGMLNLPSAGIYFVIAGDDSRKVAVR